MGPNGLTLYGFTNDVQAASTCYGTCADAWPPVIVSDDWTAGPGLDFGIFATTVRDDGQLQLVAGKWPLYYFAGDAVPGDIKGQGSGDVWFVVDTDGGLITDSAVSSEPSGDGADAAPNGEDTATGQAGQASPTEGGPGGDRPVATADSPARPGPGPTPTDSPSTASCRISTPYPPATTLVRTPGRHCWSMVRICLPGSIQPNTRWWSATTARSRSERGVWPLYRFAGDARPWRRQRPGIR